MTAAGFRALALSMPEAIEGTHMGHPDFRVGGKVFATLDAAGLKGVVKLAPEQQAMFMAAEPLVFSPCAGAWGRRGYTNVALKPAKKGAVTQAMELAWTGVAPTGLQGDR